MQRCPPKTTPQSTKHVERAATQSRALRWSPTSPRSRRTRCAKLGSHASDERVPWSAMVRRSAALSIARTHAPDPCNPISLARRCFKLARHSHTYAMAPRRHGHVFAAVSRSSLNNRRRMCKSRCGPPDPRHHSSLEPNVRQNWHAHRGTFHDSNAYRLNLIAHVLTEMHSF